ncbi:MAG TPA: hypothetical protein VIL65_02035 [Beijerinckiaceae bacterium]|jgi:hypothetical protein
MIERRLITVAEDLSRRTGRRPREAFMRRAVSTAYYALFNALARMCANELIGGSKAHTPEWTRVYRALDHRGAKSALQSSDAAALDRRVARIGRAFAVLQERRHQADYDPAFFPFYFDETTALVQLASSAIDDLHGLGVEDRRSLATLLLFKRPGGQK